MPSTIGTGLLITIPPPDGISVHRKVTPLAFHQASLTIRRYPFILPSEERKELCPRTKHNDLARSWTQPSQAGLGGWREGKQRQVALISLLWSLVWKSNLLVTATQWGRGGEGRGGEGGSSDNVLSILHHKFSSWSWGGKGDFGCFKSKVYLILPEALEYS